MSNYGPKGPQKGSVLNACRSLFVAKKTDVQVLKILQQRFPDRPVLACRACGLRLVRAYRVRLIGDERK